MTMVHISSNISPSMIMVIFTRNILRIAPDVYVNSPIMLHWNLTTHIAMMEVLLMTQH